MCDQVWLIQLKLVLGREERVDERGRVGGRRVDGHAGIGYRDARVGDAAGADGARLLRPQPMAAVQAPTAVERQVQRDAGLLFPVDDVRDVGRAHLDVGRRAVGPGRDALQVGRAGVVGRIGGGRGALVLRAPLVVGEEEVVDVLAEVVAVQAEVGVLGDPVDQARRQQQPLHLVGVVVEIQRELGDTALRVAVVRRVDEHARERVPGRIGEQRCVVGPGDGRGPVAVRARVEGDRALELRERREPCGGQRARGPVEHTGARRVRAQGCRRVHVAVDLAHAEGGLVAKQRGQLPGGVVGR